MNKKKFFKNIKMFFAKLYCKCKNFMLFLRYPWLKSEWDGWFETYTEYDSMPYGWRKAFGKQMLKEIDIELRKKGKDFRKEFKVEQIKEKFGELRFYTTYGGDEIYEIIDKYAYLSSITCIECGKPAEYMSKGWISPFCETCAKRLTGKVKDGEDFDQVFNKRFTKLKDFK